MLDVFGIPSSTKADIQTFYATTQSIGAGVSWQTWRKPRGCSMSYMMVIDGGGGGGGGFSAAAGSARGGGGGGGCSAVVSAIIPLMFLPDLLYIQVGQGGPGGAAGVSGTSGTLSGIWLYPSTGSAAVYQSVLANGSNPAGGGAGTGAAAGAAGSGGSSLSSIPRVLNISSFRVVNGQPGSAGGPQTGGVGVTIGYTAQSTFLTGGTGGAGTGTGNTDNTGGILNGAGIPYAPTIIGGTTGGGAGTSGYFNMRPLIAMGGTGGGSSGAAGTGGKGGNGAYGCGGGGGGGGVTGGAGGDAGNGLVIIISW